ncbi:MAG: helix-turn-helix domain-containing protein, partial [Campylobacterota bacterium]|nr:helix-turn-helix domain-containing protein [Campylobacterota bacterium]
MTNLSHKVSETLNATEEINGTELSTEYTLNRWLTISELEDEYKLTRSNQKEMINTNEIPYDKIGRKIIYDRYEIDAWLMDGEFGWKIYDVPIIENDPTSTVEPSASTTDVIIAQNEIEDNTITKARRTGHSSQRWANKDEKILLIALKDEKPLSELKLLLSNRTENAILKRARDFDFKSNKKADDTYFSPNVKRRNGTAKTDKTIEYVGTQETNKALDTVPEINVIEQSIDVVDTYNKDLKVIVEMLYKANSLEKRSADIVETLLNE